ncbi:MAG: hypothetical protein II901_03980 [Paludibacteraceae bacterium]|nr:hypothetical protein [Paludibacteraceae bacterium]MBQ6983750.1 hypothetical protein [Paludibacteraceae bacterium]
METTITHLEMDCIHDHLNKTMTCSWLDGRVRIVVYWEADTLGVIRDGNVVETRDLEGLSLDEFVRLEDECQAAADKLADFEEPAYAHV